MARADGERSGNAHRSGSGSVCRRDRSEFRRIAARVELERTGLDRFHEGDRLVEITQRHEHAVRRGSRSSAEAGETATGLRRHSRLCTAFQRAVETGALQVSRDRRAVSGFHDAGTRRCSPGHPPAMRSCKHALARAFPVRATAPAVPRSNSPRPTPLLSMRFQSWRISGEDGPRTATVRSQSAGRHAPGAAWLSKLMRTR